MQIYYDQTRPLSATEVDKLDEYIHHHKDIKRLINFDFAHYANGAYQKHCYGKYMGQLGKRACPDDYQVRTPVFMDPPEDSISKADAALTNAYSLNQFDKDNENLQIFGSQKRQKRFADDDTLMEQSIQMHQPQQQ